MRRRLTWSVAAAAAVATFHTIRVVSREPLMSAPGSGAPGSFPGGTLEEQFTAGKVQQQSIESANHRWNHCVSEQQRCWVQAYHSSGPTKCVWPRSTLDCTNPFGPSPVLRKDDERAPRGSTQIMLLSYGILCPHSLAQRRELRSTTGRMLPRSDALHSRDDSQEGRHRVWLTTVSRCGLATRSRCQKRPPGRSREHPEIEADEADQVEATTQFVHADSPWLTTTTSKLKIAPPRVSPPHAPSAPLAESNPAQRE